MNAGKWIAWQDENGWGSLGRVKGERRFATKALGNQQGFKAVDIKIEQARLLDAVVIDLVGVHNHASGVIERLLAGEEYFLALGSTQGGKVGLLARATVIEVAVATLDRRVRRKAIIGIRSGFANRNGCRVEYLSRKKAWTTISFMPITR